MRTRVYEPRVNEDVLAERRRENRIREFDRRAPKLFFKPQRETFETERARRFTSRDLEPVERTPRGTAVRRAPGAEPEYPGRRASAGSLHSKPLITTESFELEKAIRQL